MSLKAAAAFVRITLSSSPKALISAGTAKAPSGPICPRQFAAASRTSRTGSWRARQHDVSLVRPPAQQCRLAEPGCWALTDAGHLGRVGKLSRVLGLFRWPCSWPIGDRVGHLGKAHQTARSARSSFRKPAFSGRVKNWWPCWPCCFLNAASLCNNNIYVFRPTGPRWPCWPCIWPRTRRTGA
jgi:hypothetical protein